MYFYSHSIKPGNKDPLIIISLIKAGQLQPQLRCWQCWLRQRIGSAQQRQCSVSGSAAALAATVSAEAAAAASAAVAASAAAAAASINQKEINFQIGAIFGRRWLTTR